MSDSIADQAALAALVKSIAVVSDVARDAPQGDGSRVVFAWASYAASPLLVSVEPASNRSGVGVMLARGQVNDVPGVVPRTASAADVAALIREAEAWVRGRLPDAYVAAIESRRDRAQGVGA